MKARNSRAHELLDLAGLGDKAESRPHELSGGQRQMIALTRALAVDPDVVLWDELLGTLDLKLRRQMQEELKLIQRQVGTTFVHVTHDHEEVMAVTDRIMVMNHSRIEHKGRPEDVYLTPQKQFSVNFMGNMNIIPAKIRNVTATTPFGIVEDVAPCENTILGPRPKNVGLNGEIGLGTTILKSSAVLAPIFGSNPMLLEAVS